MSEIDLGKTCYDDLIQTCSEKARDAGKLDEYTAATRTYGRFVFDPGALSVLALARTGVDVTALETLFFLREQEQQDRIARSILAESPAFLTESARIWADQGYPAPAPKVMEQMRTAGVSAREFADEILRSALPNKTTP
jgi:hypothetical protein